MSLLLATTKSKIDNNKVYKSKSDAETGLAGARRPVHMIKSGLLKVFPSKTNLLKRQTTSKATLKDDAAAKKRYDDYKIEWDEILRMKKVTFEWKWVSLPKSVVSVHDFERVRTLGHGSFGRVLLVKHKKTQKPYALKVMSKREIVQKKQVEHTLNEKKILSTTSFPFLVSFAYSFKDNANLFLVLEFVSGGEMFSHLVKQHFFSEKTTRFYIAQVVLAIEYLHSLDILHRDLKPENTLIAADGYIKVTDFGFAKVVKTRAFTFCGTPEYLAPEIISHDIYGKAVDWWSVGVLTYELASGMPPFSGEDKIAMYENILKGRYKPLNSHSNALRDFLQNMIQVDVTKRYGCLRGGVDDIKMHKWFQQLDWMAIYKKQVTPPFIPKVKSADDASNFDPYEEKAFEKSEHYCLYEAEFRQF